MYGSNMKDVEIEIQVRISDDTKLRKFLEEKAEFTGESYQKDEYFTPQHRNFIGITPVAEWLRLRESSAGSVTYKNWHYNSDGKGEYCDEYESDVGNIDQMRKIFAALNIAPVITVEKLRKTWRYDNYEIALDRVTDLGDFVEVEYKARHHQGSPKEILSEMIAFLKKIDCGKIEQNFVGYPFMLLYPNEVKFEEV